MKESTEYSLSLGNAVKIAREHFGITQEKIAEFIGKDSRTVLTLKMAKKTLNWIRFILWFAT